MEKITKSSRIVETCANIMKDPSKVANEDFRDAQTVIKELASVPNPNNIWELSQLIGFLVDDKFNQNISQYITEIADVKNVGLGDKAEFKMQKGIITALWQAKGSTAQRTMVGTEYKTLETDEISVAPAVELEQLQNGQIDFSSLVNDAANAMEYEVMKKVQTTLYTAIQGLGTPNYGSGSGVTTTIDPIITAVSRLGSPVVLGDVALLQKFVGIVGFNNWVAESIAVDFHRTGLIGNYRGARLVQLNNPLMYDTDMTTTVLDKGYAYVLPAGQDVSKRPLKLVFEGDMQTYQQQYNQSRTLEIAMYKKIGVGVASTRYGMGLYEDTSL